MPEVPYFQLPKFQEDAGILFKGQRVSGFIQKPYTSMGIAEKVEICIG